MPSLENSNSAFPESASSASPVDDSTFERIVASAGLRSVSTDRHPTAPSLTERNFPASTSILKFVAAYDRRGATEQTEAGSLRNDPAVNERLSDVFGYASYLWNNRFELVKLLPLLKGIDLSANPTVVMEDLLSACPEQTAAIFLRDHQHCTRAAHAFDLRRYHLYSSPRRAPETRLSHEVWEVLSDRTRPPGLGEPPRDVLATASAKVYGGVWNVFQDFLWSEFGEAWLERESARFSTEAGRQQRGEEIQTELITGVDDFVIEMFLAGAGTQSTQTVYRGILLSSVLRPLEAAGLCSLNCDAFEFRPRRGGVTACEVAIGFYRFLYDSSSSDAKDPGSSAPRFSRDFAHEAAAAVHGYLLALEAKHVTPAMANVEGEVRKKFEVRAKLLDEAIGKITRQEVSEYLSTFEGRELAVTQTALLSVFVPWLQRQDFLADVQQSGFEPAEFLTEVPRARKGRPPRAELARPTSEPLVSEPAVPNLRQGPRLALVGRPEPVPVLPEAKVLSSQSSLLDSVRRHAESLDADIRFKFDRHALSPSQALAWAEKYFEYIETIDDGGAKTPDAVDEAVLHNPEHRLRNFLFSLPTTARPDARLAIVEFLYPYLVEAHASNFDRRLENSFEPPRAPMLPEIRNLWIGLEQRFHDLPRTDSLVRMRALVANEFFSAAWREALASVSQDGLDAEELSAARMAHYRRAAIEDPSALLESSLRGKSGQERGLGLSALYQDFFAPLFAAGETEFNPELHRFHPIPLTAPRLPEVRSYYDELAYRYNQTPVSEAERREKISAERALVQQLEEDVWARLSRKGVVSRAAPLEQAELFRAALLQDGAAHLEKFLPTLPERQRRAGRETLLLGLFEHLEETSAGHLHGGAQRLLGQENAKAPEAAQLYAQHCYKQWRSNPERQKGDAEWEAAEQKVKTFCDFLNWMNLHQVPAERVFLQKHGIASDPADPYLIERSLRNHAEGKLALYFEGLTKRQADRAATLSSDAFPWLSGQMGFPFDVRLVQLARTPSSPQTELTHRFLMQPQAEAPEPLTGWPLKRWRERSDIASRYFEFCHAQALAELPARGSGPLKDQLAKEKEIFEKKLLTATPAQIRSYVQGLKSLEAQERAKVGAVLQDELYGLIRVSMKASPAARSSAGESDGEVVVEKKRRGRPPRVRTPEELAAQAERVAQNADGVSDAPKRRGRPPRVRTAAELAEIAARDARRAERAAKRAALEVEEPDSSVSAPKRLGRPPRAVGHDNELSAAPKRSRTAAKRAEQVETAAPQAALPEPEPPRAPVARSLPEISYGKLFAAECAHCKVTAEDLGFPLTAELAAQINFRHELSEEDLEVLSSLGGADGISVYLNFCEFHWRHCQQDIADFPAQADPEAQRVYLAGKMSELLGQDLVAPMQAYLREVQPSADSYLGLRNTLLDLAVSVQPEQRSYYIMSLCSNAPYDKAFADWFHMLASRQEPITLSSGIKLPALTEQQAAEYYDVVSNYLDAAVARCLRMHPNRNWVSAGELRRVALEIPGGTLAEFCGANLYLRTVLADSFFWLHQQGHTHYQVMRTVEFPAYALDAEVLEDEEVDEESTATSLPVAAENAEVVRMSPKLELTRNNCMIALAVRHKVPIASLAEMCLADVDLEAERMQVSSVDLSNERSIYLPPISRKLILDYLEAVLAVPEIEKLVEHGHGDSPFFFDLRGGNLAPLQRALLDELQAQVNSDSE
ncbi:MAG: hypothetical protein J0M12_10465 [Deltaproteobacteria bacterium]|nr:hypothetical protein [Deltaproteobacteria bacterium]